MHHNLLANVPGRGMRSPLAYYREKVLGLHANAVSQSDLRLSQEELVFYFKSVIAFKWLQCAAGRALARQCAALCTLTLGHTLQEGEGGNKTPDCSLCLTVPPSAVITVYRSPLPNIHSLLPRHADPHQAALHTASWILARVEPSTRHPQSCPPRQYTAGADGRSSPRLPPNSRGRSPPGTWPPVQYVTKIKPLAHPKLLTSAGWLFATR